MFDISVAVAEGYCYNESSKTERRMIAWSISWFVPRRKGNLLRGRRRRPVGQAVKTPASHAGNAGSIPARVTRGHDRPWGGG